MPLEVSKKIRYEAVVVGASAGGLAALSQVLSALPGDFPLPVAVVLHLGPDSDNFAARHLAADCALPVKEAEEKEGISGGTVYMAPPGYHLLVEEERTFSLSTEEPVIFSRPAIDPLFETAAEAFCEGLVGVILTGASPDGARGLSRVKALGGLAVVQSAESAEAKEMPRAAMAAVAVDHVLDLAGIGPFLRRLAKREI